MPDGSARDTSNTVSPTTGPSRRGWSAYVEEMEEVVIQWMVLSRGRRSVPASRSTPAPAQTPAPPSLSSPRPSFPWPPCQTHPGGATSAPVLMPLWLSKATSQLLLLLPPPPRVTNGHPPQVSSCMGYQVTRQGGGCPAARGSMTSLFLNLHLTPLFFYAVFKKFSSDVLVYIVLSWVWSLTLLGVLKLGVMVMVKTDVQYA